MSRFSIGWSGVRIDVRAAATLTASQPCVFVANHQSYLDYPIMASIFPANTVVVAKREIARIPAVGILFRLAGQPVIDRDRAASAHATISALADRIRRERISVWMFPEGTRNKTVAPLLPFKKGAFHLAMEAGVPVVPIVLAPLRPLFDFERGVIAGRSVQLRVLEPEAPGSTASELHDRVRRAMLDALGQAPAR